MSDDLIKRSDVYKAVDDWLAGRVSNLNIKDIPSADRPSIDIVRCQDCKYWVYHFNGCSRNPCTEPWYATDFCSYGERKDQ